MVYRQKNQKPDEITMNKISIYCALLLAITFLAAGCRKQSLPDAASPPALLYASKCSLCHPPFHPQVHTSTGWKKVIPRMEKNMEAIGIKHLLSEEEKSIILDYLGKHASKVL